MNKTIKHCMKGATLRPNDINELTCNYFCSRNEGHLGDCLYEHPARFTKPKFRIKKKMRYKQEYPANDKRESDQK